MVKFRILVIALDIFISAVILCAGLGISLIKYSKMPYGPAEAIISIAGATISIYFLNRVLLKIAKKETEKIEENNKDTLFKTDEINKTEEEKIKKLPEETEEIKEKKPLKRSIRIAVSVGSIIFTSLIFLTALSHSFRMPNLAVAIAVEVLIFTGIVWKILKWNHYQALKYEEYYEKESEKIQPEIAQIEAQENEASEKEKHKRILITDDSWKEFHLPDAEGHTISDYRQIGISMFLDVTNWDAYTIFKEIEMFDPELKNDLYYKHKQEIFMKVNDRDYRYPKVVQSDMLRPEEIFQVEIEPKTPSPRKTKLEIERGKDEDEEDEK